MENSKFVFLILHYKVVEETIECIESILKFCDTPNFEIVVVDNFSNNKTSEILKEKYNNYSNIHIIISKENLGFANGNNMGYKYIKENLKADFIIILNNDTSLITTDFCNVIYNEYIESDFAVMGPRIILACNKINEYAYELPTIKQTKKIVAKYKRMYYFNKIHFTIVYALCEKIYNIFNNKILHRNRRKIDKSKRKEDVLVQGCCIVLSKKYIDKFDTAFDDRTFLYNEEELLYIRLKKNNLLSVFNPYLMIFHNESVAIKKTSKGMREKNMLVAKNRIKSGKILLLELQNIGQNELLERIQI